MEIRPKQRKTKNINPFDAYMQILYCKLQGQAIKKGLRMPRWGQGYSILIWCLKQHLYLKKFFYATYRLYLPCHWTCVRFIRLRLCPLGFCHGFEHCTVVVGRDFTITPRYWCGPLGYIPTFLCCKTTTIVHLDLSNIGNDLKSRTKAGGMLP